MKRPPFITVIGVLDVLGALAFGVAGATWISEWWNASDIVVGSVLCFVALTRLITAVGIFRMRAWGRIAELTFLWIVVVASLGRGANFARYSGSLGLALICGAFA